jgi:hypothetical protein
MKPAALLLALILLAHPAIAEVVRQTPDLAWVDSTGAKKSLVSLRGKPIVVLIAKSPRQWAFRSQVGQLQKIYERFAAQGLVCIVAFSEEQGVIRSNIPFLHVPNGVAAAAAYDAPPKGFAIAIIGEDGNLDYISNRVVPAQRIYDIVDNSYVRQMQLRRK